MEQENSFSVSRISLGDVEISVNPSEAVDRSPAFSMSHVLPAEVRIDLSNFTGTLSVSRRQQVIVTDSPAPPSLTRKPIGKDMEDTPRRSNESQKRIEMEAVNEPEIRPSATFDSKGSLSTASSVYDDTIDGLIIPDLRLMQAETDETRLESYSSEGEDDTEEGDDSDGASSSLHQEHHEISRTAELSEKTISFSEKNSVVFRPSKSGVILSKETNSSALTSDSGFPTMLHNACARPNATLLELESILATDPEAASKPDVRGRLPLHVLSENRFLLESRKGRMIARDFAFQLMETSMDGITTEDYEGHVPFAVGIRQWVSDACATDDAPTDQSSHGIRNERPSRQDGGEANTRLPLTLSDLTTKQTHPEIDSGPAVEWLFTMLAMGLDQVSGKNRTGKQKLPRRRIRASRLVLAENVASIPNLLKAILLIEDSHSRHKILRLSIIKRVVLCSKSIGPWVLWMLHAHGTPSQRVVDYFELLSQVSLKEYAGGFRSLRPEDVSQFHEERKKAVDAVTSMDIVPSLTVLDNNEIERAASTELIWKILTDGISRPFVIGIVTIDFVLHVALILAFRTQARVINPDTKTVDPFGTTDFEYAITMTLSSYFMIRIVTQGIAFFFTSWRVFKSFFLDFWKLLEVATIILTMIAASAIHNDLGDANLSAITVGLLWLKLLFFLKNINLQLATYVLAIIEIIKDIRWFMVIVVVAIFMFGEMMHIITTQTSSGRACWGDPDLAVTDFCEGFVDSYLRMYTVLLGDFNLHTYRELRGITVLFVLFTLLGFIVLLNVLIAVVGDSYEKSRLASRHLFGRARVGFLAEHLAMERLLHPRFRSLKARREETQGRSITKQRRVFSMLGRWTILLSLLGAAAFAGVLLVTAAVHMIKDTYNTFALVVVIILAVLLITALLATASSLFGGWLDAASSPRAKRIVGAFNSGMLRAIRVVSVGVFGAPANLSSSWDSSVDGEEDEWQGRLNYLSRSVCSIVAKSERSVQAAVQSSEFRLKDHERILAKQISSKIDKMKQG